MQGTVRSYDETAGSGTVFTDDGTVLAFPAAALAGTGLRLLRPGQRVRFRLDGRGAVAALTLATFPLPPPPADPLPPRPADPSPPPPGG